MAYTVKCNSGYKIYDTECASIEEACDHAKAMFRLHTDSGGNGCGHLASQLPRIDAEIDRIRETGSGTVHTIPGGGDEQTSWTIKEKKGFRSW
jgi:hypothetical protein